MAAMTVIAAETDREAQFLASSQDQSFVRLRSGDPGRLPPPIEDYRENLGPAERGMLERMDVARAVGGPQTVREKMLRFIERTQADELILSGATFDPAARRESLKLAMEAVRD
jgi:alkanesulfonate monooxygenase SsuD/methylene tetrahydromethanopterin reductase-like flavin-dependent oxidoreductase (luciferase family)